MSRTVDPLQRYDTARDSLLGKSADGLTAPPPVTYWSVARARDRRSRVALWRKAWRWLLQQVPW